MRRSLKLTYRLLKPARFQSFRLPADTRRGLPRVRESEDVREPGNSSSQAFLRPRSQLGWHFRYSEERGADLRVDYSSLCSCFHLFWQRAAIRVNSPANGKSHSISSENIRKSVCPESWHMLQRSRTANASFCRKKPSSAPRLRAVRTALAAAFVWLSSMYRA